MVAHGGRDLISHDSWHCLEYPSTKAWPTRRKGPLDMAARLDGATQPPTDFEARFDAGVDEAHLVGEIRHPEADMCPYECRPPQHKDWVDC